MCRRLRRALDVEHSAKRMLVECQIQNTQQNRGTYPFCRVQNGLCWVFLALVKVTESGRGSLSRTHSMSLRCWPYRQLGAKSSCIVAYIISLGWDGRARAVAAERQIKTAYLIQQRRATTWGWKFVFYGALGLTQTHPKQDVFPS